MSGTLLRRMCSSQPVANAGWIAVRSLCALGCAFIPVHSALADSLSVTEWFLSCSANGPGSNDDPYAFFDTAQSPFVGQHSVSLASSPSTTASAQYLIEYMSSYGSFHIASQQQAAALSYSGVYTGASGHIWLTTTEPMPLHIDASWTYSLPVDYMTASMLVTVSGAQSHVTIFGQSHQAGTFPGEPAFGTLAIDGDVTLAPGETWILRYEITTHAYSGTEAYAATGFGFVDFQITPEPATLVLLSPLLLAIRGHAKRPRRTPSA